MRVQGASPTILAIALISVSVTLATASFRLAMDAASDTGDIGNWVAALLQNASTEIVGAVALYYAFTGVIERRQQREAEQSRLAELTADLLTQLRRANPEQAAHIVERLRQSGAFWKLEGVALARTTLTGVDLSAMHAPAVDFTGATLDRCSLDFAELDHGCFEGASLVETSLIGARLKLAKFRSATLSGANLSWTILTGAQDLSDAELATASGLLGAVMPDGQRYDGRFNLHGDVAEARARGFDLISPSQRRQFYFGDQIRTFVEKSS